MTDQLLLVVGVTMLCMLSPGPDMVLVMRNTLVGGRWAGGMTATGVLTGNLVHISYCTLGLGLIVSRSPTAYTALKLASASYLLYLGIQNLRSTGASSGDPAAPAQGPQRTAYIQGLFNNLLNPKGGLFYLGVFAQLITPQTSRAQTLLLIATMMSVSATFWLLFVQTLHLQAVRTLLGNSRVAIDRVFGVVLVALAAKVAIS